MPWCNLLLLMLCYVQVQVVIGALLQVVLCLSYVQVVICCVLTQMNYLNKVGWLLITCIMSF